MLDPVCTPLPSLAPTDEGEAQPDGLAELLESMADLLVLARRQQAEISDRRPGDDPRAVEAITRLELLQDALEDVAVETASVHQLLVHAHLI